MINVWSLCWRAPEESTMIEQWPLYTSWSQPQMGGFQIWLPLMFFCVVTACIESNPLRVFYVVVLWSTSIICVYLFAAYCWFKFAEKPDPFFSLSSDTQGSLLEHFVTVIDRCEHFSFSIQVVFLEVRKCDLSLFFLLNFTNILFLSTWVSELHRNWFWLLLSREG